MTCSAGGDFGGFCKSLKEHRNAPPCDLPDPRRHHWRLRNLARAPHHCRPDSRHRRGSLPVDREVNCSVSRDRAMARRVCSRHARMLPRRRCLHLQFGVERLAFGPAQRLCHVRMRRQIHSAPAAGQTSNSKHSTPNTKRKTADRPPFLHSHCENRIKHQRTTE